MSINPHTSMLKQYMNVEIIHPLQQDTLISLPIAHPTRAGDLDDEQELGLNRLLVLFKKRGGLIVGTAAFVTAMGGIWSALETPKYEGSFQLLVEPVTPQEPANKLMSAMQTANATLDYETQIQLLWSPRVMSPIIKELQDRYPDLNYESLFNKEFSGDEVLSVTRQKKTKLLEIRYRSSDPEKVKFVLEKIAEGYLKYSLEDRQTDSTQAIKYIEIQLPGLRKRVDEQQEKIQEFRQQYNFIEPQFQGVKLTEQMRAINNERLQVETVLNQQEKLYEILQSRLGLAPDEALAASALTQAPAYQKLLNNLQNIESQIAIELSRFTENNPKVKFLREQQQTLMSLLQQEAEKVLGTEQALKTLPFQDSLRLNLTQQLVDAANNIQVVQARLKAVVGEESRLNKQAQDFLVLVQQYSNLEWELQIATRTLNQLLAQRESLRLEAAKEDVPWELISPPELMEDKEGNARPVVPNLPKNLALAGFLGLVLGAGSALVAEKLDRFFHSVDELEKTLKLPVLGTIPDKEFIKEKNRLKFDKENTSQSAFREAFRVLFTKLWFLKFGTPIKSLTISSATSGDGKSTVAINCALAAAALNRRVLLVDADLRQPQVQQRLGLSNHLGLSEAIYLGLDAESVIQKVPNQENLFVVAAGEIKMDGGRFLASRQMEFLMGQFEKEFDFVIYDSPPLLNVAAAKILAKNTDGLLLVARLGQTDRNALLQVFENLKIAKVPVLGLVANGVKT
ncbi:polysaccharide biosynthesis tyrosine autokinase [Ancylothrix sp. C2]|uniref:GumC family protein n=1 Tax=Ancylothrix sp. D3o TaxID=2953691 RepID=UPI0021BAFC1B|nr:polysaccharide biosynthesis tyrosine autokinase [Ancylothrix sp. D3o]MCT7952136.1 polysaccharide biosynthesis tyrosine autokinase [Ancylothrix sp. D3o]